MTFHRAHTVTSMRVICSGTHSMSYVVNHYLLDMAGVLVIEFSSNAFETMYCLTFMVNHLRV